MKLIVEIKLRDDTVQRHECNDFPYLTDRFFTLYKEGFLRESIALETIQQYKFWFEK